MTCDWPSGPRGETKAAPDQTGGLLVQASLFLSFSWWPQFFVIFLFIITSHPGNILRHFLIPLPCDQLMRRCIHSSVCCCFFFSTPRLCKRSWRAIVSQFIFVSSRNVMQYGNFCYSFLYSSISFIYLSCKYIRLISPQLCLFANVVTEKGRGLLYISKPGSGTGSGRARWRRTRDCWI